MRHSRLFITVCALLIVAVWACPTEDGWVCKSADALSERNDDSLRTLVGEFDLLEEIYLNQMAKSSDMEGAAASFKFLYFLKSGEKMISMKLDDFPEAQQKLRAQMRISVVLGEDDELLAFKSNIASRALFLSNNPRTLTSATYKEGTPTELNIYVARVNFGSTPAPCSMTTVRNLLGATDTPGNVKHTYRTVSSNLITVSYTFRSSAITLNSAYNSGCEVGLWTTDLRAAVPTGYTYYWYFQPKATCGWAGLAQVSPNCRGCWSLNNLCIAMVPTHEGGHNQGLLHSGERSTYDDYSDYMGNGGGFKLLNAIKKIRLGYVTPDNLLINPSAGIYKLTSLDADFKSAPSPQVLLFNQGTHPVTLALRSLLGEGLVLAPKYRNKVNVVSEPTSNSKFHTALSTNDTFLPAFDVPFKVIFGGGEEDAEGNMLTAYVALCDGACPDRKFVAVCDSDSGDAIEGCVDGNQKSRDAFECVAVRSDRVKAIDLGPGKPCVEVNAATKISAFLFEVLF